MTVNRGVIGGAPIGAYAVSGGGLWIRAVGRSITTVTAPASISARAALRGHCRTASNVAVGITLRSALFGQSTTAVTAKVAPRVRLRAKALAVSSADGKTRVARRVRALASSKSRAAIRMLLRHRYFAPTDLKRVLSLAPEDRWLRVPASRLEVGARSESHAARARRENRRMAP